MYYVWRAFQPSGAVSVIEFDLGPTIPRKLREAAVPGLPGTSTNDLVAYDDIHKKLFFVDVFNVNEGTTIRRFDLRTFKADGQWDLTASAPGFVATGITYAPVENRLYMIGTLSGNGAFDPAAFADTLGRAPVSAPVAVVAADAHSGVVQWIKPVPQCAQPLYEYSIGTFIGRSSRQNALYFFCFTGGVLSGAFTFPGGTGVIRLRIDPKGNQNSALSFPVEFFPISGAYSGQAGTARASLDHPSDRLFVQSLSPLTPGAWSFDGTISAWVGLISATDSYDVNLGINEVNGHYYLGSSSAAYPQSKYLLVSNARMTPPPQGQVFTFPVAGTIFTDSGSHRLFVSLADGAKTNIYVLEDDTPNPEEQQPVDYDDITTNVDEGPNTLASFDGSLTGFGARVLVVGGSGGATSFLSSDVTNGIANPQDVSRQLGLPVPALEPGDRGVFLARVGTADLSNSGSTASAQAVAPDDITSDDVTNLNNFVGTTAPPAGGSLDWRWEPAVCLDGSGDHQKIDKPGPNGTSSVVCDLSRDMTTASSSVTGATLGPITIGSATFGASVTREANLGTLSTATAETKNFELNLPGVGVLSIADVLAKATTLAHGRPGSATASYHRIIRGVTISDPSGNQVFSCGNETTTCDLESVANAVNSNLGLKVRIDFPAQDELATPRGAFARVQKSLREFIGGQAENNDSLHSLPAIQLTINNDAAAKSRVVIQLASIQTSSIYGISLLPPDQFGNGNPIPQVLGTTTVPGPVVTQTVPQYYQSQLRIPVAAGIPGGGVLLARSAKDTAIVMLIFLLLAGTVVSAYRRHSLIQHLEE